MIQFYDLFIAIDIIITVIVVLLINLTNNIYKDSENLLS
jgi:hypothetical protein